MTPPQNITETTETLKRFSSKRLNDRGIQNQQILCLRNISYFEIQIGLEIRLKQPQIVANRRNYGDECSVITMMGAS